MLNVFLTHQSSVKHSGKMSYRGKYNEPGSRCFVYPCLFMINNSLVCFQLKYPKINSHISYFCVTFAYFLHSWDICVFYRTIIGLSEILSMAALGCQIIVIEPADSVWGCQSFKLIAVMQSFNTEGFFKLGAGAQTLEQLSSRAGTSRPAERNRTLNIPNFFFFLYAEAGSYVAF